MTFSELDTESALSSGIEGRLASGTKEKCGGLRRMQLVEGRGGRVVIGAEARGSFVISRGEDLFLLQTEEDGSEELRRLDVPDGDGWHQ